MLFYRAAVDLLRSTLNYVAGIIRRHRKAIGSVRRRLNPGQQALLVLVYLRKGETFAELGAGFGVSLTTAWRYVEETVAQLTARSPKLDQALRKAARDGLQYLVLDGMFIHTDRVKADRPFFSGKHRVHGMNVQVIASPDGTIIGTSGSLPGKSHDLTAARVWGILKALERAGILTLTDKGYQGAEGPLVTPYKGKNKPDSQKQANRAHARLRGPGERANAQLKSWRILRKLRCCPHKAGQLCKAIAVLQNYELARG
ncbi:transposase family protein [Nonomuraea typhae]|uniref:Transposase family protein n=1 Tax=Nonomuraea typhae TaxID=2603600 RepID=A0ABW7ZC75_9ACTN